MYSRGGAVRATLLLTVPEKFPVKKTARDAAGANFCSGVERETSPAEAHRRSLPSKLRCHVFDLGAVKGLGNLGTRGLFGWWLAWGQSSVSSDGRLFLFAKDETSLAPRGAGFSARVVFGGARTISLPSTTNETLASQSSILEAPS